MLHTKFQVNRPFGSREEDFRRFLPCIGMAAILVMWPGPFEQTFVPPSLRWKLTSIGLVVPEEKIFETYTYTPIQMTEAYLYYKLTIKPSAQLS